ncbi:MAG TPA: hypothetical protein PLI09_01080 [Candidatus Hydrogenedentes bacterium]|nr:hypothetical protein [Candidatus Hydrogenedentota bacterium]
MSTREEVIVAINAAVGEREGRTTLRCPDAFRIAGEFSVGVGLIGNLCNELHIKIVQCQLGCFK